MKAFELNRHGRMVFPSNIIPELDFSTMETLEQLDSVIRRDFETKAPTGKAGDSQTISARCAPLIGGRACGRARRGRDARSLARARDRG